MHVLLIGSGGREHALAWKIAQSPLLSKLTIAPGNAGMAPLGELVDIAAMDIERIVDFAKSNNVDFVVVGPEDPLVAGLADRLTDEGVKTFGPSAAAARLEGSKVFTKDLCKKYDIPSAAYGRFAEITPALVFLDEMRPPYVVKADGLAAGKGVVIAQTMPEAEAAVRDILGGKFGAAGAEIIIEEFLDGQEASFFILCDGQTLRPLIGAQDHKRAFDGDEGPNTGGMGAYSPAPVFTKEVERRAMDDIVRPTIDAMAAEGAPFKGVLYAGLMIDDKGAPKLIEYNVRFGDPECQIMMRRLTSDFLPALMACADGTLEDVDVTWSDDMAVTVVMATNGYPDAYKKGSVIRGLDDAASDPAVEIFHAGTKRAGGDLQAHGGRVLNVTATGPDLKAAIAKAYAAVDKIDWPEGFCRRDIGWRAL